jgi:hypothetical protein
MTLESLINGLTHDEKLAAMDLLWRDLSRVPSQYVSPEWHERVIADRLTNPAPGERLGLGDAKVEVKKQLDARRTRG